MLTKLPRVLVTGATGFVGAFLCQFLLQKGYRVKATGRQPQFFIKHPMLEYKQIVSIDENTDWGHWLNDVEVVVHLAARVHHMQDKGMQQLAQYQKVNVQGTQALAKAAIAHQVKRFIFLSSIKVNGEQTFDTSFRADAQPRPQDAYSVSKLQGEQILQEVCRRSGMEWVIIRPPLIYGAGVQGNFQRLLKLAKSGLPLPFATLKNTRSLVSIQNLSDFIECCIHHQNASGEVFLVSDDSDISTAGLIKLLRKAMGRRSGLFPFPKGLVKLSATCVGKRKEMQKLLGSLTLNIEKSKRLLNWVPPFTLEQSLEMLIRLEQEAGAANVSTRMIEQQS